MTIRSHRHPLRSTRVRRAGFLAGVAVTSTIVLTACSSTNDKAVVETPQITNKALSTPITSVTDGATNVAVSTPILVSAGEALQNVALTAADGTVIEGQLADGNKQWTTNQTLTYGTTYTLTATTAEGQTTSTFTTLTPSVMTDGSLAPLDQSTVGIGQTIALRFDEVIKDRKAVQDAITVTTTPHVDGAFYWVSNQEVRWRPENYWTPGTKVDVQANLYGKDFGDGMYGQKDRHASFTIGDAVIGTADDNTKTLVITRNGQVEKTMPISMGSNANPTPNGVYILGDHNDSMIMDSRTYGLALDAGGYRTSVNYATQMSYSGIYVHSAPWSLGDQGVRNVSHGCLNVSPANAKWFLDNTKRGDIVIVKNTVGGTLPGTDGLGDWNIPWDTWKAGNANA